METIIIRVDDSEEHWLVEEAFRKMCQKTGYFTLKVEHFRDDFHTCEYPLPYLITDSGSLFGDQLTDFLNRHNGE